MVKLSQIKCLKSGTDFKFLRLPEYLTYTYRKEHDEFGDLEPKFMYNTCRNDPHLKGRITFTAALTR